MDSVGYLKRKYEISKDVTFLLIAEEIKMLQQQNSVLKGNQCQCIKEYNKDE